MQTTIIGINAGSCLSKPEENTNRRKDAEIGWCFGVADLRSLVPARPQLFAVMRSYTMDTKLTPEDYHGDLRKAGPRPVEGHDR